MRPVSLLLLLMVPQSAFLLPRLSRKMPILASRPLATTSSQTIADNEKVFPSARSKLQRASNESLVMMSFDQLTRTMDGSGKARIFWTLIRKGINPLEYEGEDPNSSLSQKTRLRLLSATPKPKLFSIQPVEETVSPCGTRKFLSELEDGAKIESVLIPASKYGRTTLCVSTQVGCDRRCAFCATGTMGLIRNLTALEIVSQVFCGLQISLREDMPTMNNIVFMGMGDAGRNIVNVGQAMNCLVDRDRFSFAASKCTVSTVGPSPEAFMELAQYPGALAWSLHAADDELRRYLVPSTRHTTVELRDNLMRALSTRPSLRTRTMMIAVTLIEGVNDSHDHAKQLADFVRPILSVAPRIAIDLIPYNDIDTNGFKRPSVQSVNEFQQVLQREGYFVGVRLPRGDNESAACGMLTTKRKRAEASLSPNIL